MSQCSTSTIKCYDTTLYQILVLAMCYTNLKIIVANTVTNTQSTYFSSSKISHGHMESWATFLRPGSNQQFAKQLKTGLRHLICKGEFKGSGFQTYIAYIWRSFSRWLSLKKRVICYDDIDSCTHICHCWQHWQYVSASLYASQILILAPLIYPSCCSCPLPS